MDDIPMIYECDPNKNKDCKKTGCYKNGGNCMMTKHPEFAKSATDILEEVKEEMCINYCKHYEKTLELMDDQEEWDKLCGECPLNRL